MAATVGRRRDLDLLEAFAACRSDGLADMLDLDLGRRFGQAAGAQSGPSPRKQTRLFCSRDRAYHAQARRSKVQIGCGLPGRRLQGKSW